MAVKYGCTVWTLMEPDYHAPYDEAVRKVAEAGFDGIELMVDDERELEEYWTDETIAHMKGLLSSSGLELIQLCMFQNMTGGLASLRPDDQDKAIELSLIHI